MTDQETVEILEEMVKNPDDWFATFSEEMAEKARQELLKVAEQYRNNIGQPNGMPS